MLAIALIDWKLFSESVAYIHIKIMENKGQLTSFFRKFQFDTIHSFRRQGRNETSLINWDEKMIDWLLNI